MKKKFTLSVFTENRVGIFSRITLIFTRRHLNIESIIASETEENGIYRFTIVVTVTREQAMKLAAQLEKQVEVLKAFVHEENETVHQEIALYKVKTSFLDDMEVENVVRKNYARFLSLNGSFAVIEKTGHYEETQKLFDDLKHFGILEFSRSGRVAVTKPMKTLSAYLE